MSNGRNEKDAANSNTDSGIYTGISRRYGSVFNYIYDWSKLIFK